MIIVNADDFGYSIDDNKVINDLILSGKIDTTTIIVNSDYYDNAVSLSKINNYAIKVGLHLNLTEFKPTSENGKACSLIDKNGYFYNNPKFRCFKGFFMSKADRCFIKKEIENQIEIFRYNFPDSDFLDSHHHIHTVFPILILVLKIAKKYNFKRIRLSLNDPKKHFPFFKKIYKNLINCIIKICFPESCDYFIEISSNFRDSNKKIEFMCHPTKLNGNCVDKVNGFPF